MVHRAVDVVPVARALLGTCVHTRMLLPTARLGDAWGEQGTGEVVMMMMMMMIMMTMMMVMMGSGLISASLYRLGWGPHSRWIPRSTLSARSARHAGSISWILKATCAPAPASPP